MKTEGWGNDAAVEIQRLSASRFLPQLTQDAFLLGSRYAETPPETHAGSSNEPGGSEMALNAGGAGGWRRDSEFVEQAFFQRKRIQSGCLNRETHAARTGLLKCVTTSLNTCGRL